MASRFVVLGRLINAIRQPQPRQRRLSLLRFLFQLPVVFDITGILLQVRDLNRVAKVHRATAVAGSKHHQEVQAYNADVTQSKQISITRRAELYYEILAMPPRALTSEKLLIVGPRNIQELFIAWTRGFRWRNISAIDLYSTNPKIVEMNMEAMTYADETFDAVSMANTLSYADDTMKAISEVARVLRPGGHFAFSATYDPGSRWKEDVVTASMIRNMLHQAGLEIYYYGAHDKTNSLGRLQSSHSFGARKRGAGDARLDKLVL